MPALTSSYRLWGPLLGIVLGVAVCRPVSGRETLSLGGGFLNGEADFIHLDPRSAVLQGRARLEFQPLPGTSLPGGRYQLHANRLQVDWKEGRVEATGGALLRLPQGEIQSTQIRFNWRLRQGQLGKARWFYPRPGEAPAEDLLAPQEAPLGLRIGAQEVNFSPQQLRLHQAYLTTCDRDPPHYSLRAKSLVLQGTDWFEEAPVPSEKWSALRLKARGVSLCVGKRRLLSLPRWTLSGKHPERDLFWLALGYDPVEGLFARIRQGEWVGADWRGDLNLRLGTARGITGEASLSREEGENRFQLAVTRYEPVPGRIPIDARVSRLPEGSYTWTPGFSSPSSDPLFTLRLSGGNFQDFRQGGQAKRANVTLMGRSQIQRGDSWKGLLGGRFSQSWYDTGDRFSVASAWMGAEFSWGQTAFVRTLYRTHWRSGNTPLPSLDEVDISRELQLTTHFLINRRLFLGLQGRYSLGRGDFEEVEYTLARRLHLLQYGLTWQDKPDTRLGLHLRVLGF